MSGQAGDDLVDVYRLSSSDDALGEIWTLFSTVRRTMFGVGKKEKRCKKQCEIMYKVVRYGLEMFP